MTGRSRPVLGIDIDGVLNPCQGRCPSAAPWVRDQRA
jgi:hypothetical protein